METERAPQKRSLIRRAALIAAAGVLSLCLIWGGLCRLFPGLPGWTDLFRTLGLRQDDPLAVDGTAAYTPGYLFLDVGQGDGAVALGSHAAVMIDAGPYDASVAVHRELRARRITRLEAIILTHPHADHIGGAVSLLRQLEVGRVYLPDWTPQSVGDGSQYDRLMQAVADTGTPLTLLHESTVLRLDDLTLEITLSPVREGSENDAGLVVRAASPAGTALFTGDIGLKAEFALMEQGIRLDADLLKVGHHGSDTSTGAAFLRRVDPREAVISVGYNTYGHPSSAVLDRLAAQGVAVHRTDREGTRLWTADGWQ